MLPKLPNDVWNIIAQELSKRNGGSVRMTNKTYAYGSALRAVRARHVSLLCKRLESWCTTVEYF